MSLPLYLADLGIVCSLGSGKTAVWQAIASGTVSGIRMEEIGGRAFNAALVRPKAQAGGFAEPFDNRANIMAAEALSELAPTVTEAITLYGADRVAVLVGSCDNGSEESFKAMEVHRREGCFPPSYRLEKQRADLPARFVAEYYGILGPRMTHSTACASSASALSSARNLIEAGFCDAVVVGGVDIVSASVQLGFSALDAVSPEPCNPFSANRKGITLGEAAAFFLLTKVPPRENRPIRLLGVGEASDAYHMTAPDPSGAGAIKAMRNALSDAGLSPEDIDYLNLHGTGTDLNDSMESRAVSAVFPHGVPVSSTKSQMGHSIGAAGSAELGICWLALSSLNEDGLLPPHLWDGVPDPSIPELDFVLRGRSTTKLRTCMSNSFAFGGCDLSIVLGIREHEESC